MFIYYNSLYLTPLHHLLIHLLPAFPRLLLLLFMVDYVDGSSASYYVHVTGKLLLGCASRLGFAGCFRSILFSELLPNRLLALPRVR
jgi:hypothetical protein